MIDLTPFDSPLFSDAYRRMVATAGGVAERRSRYNAAAPPTLRERIVRCIWFDQSLATDRLRTDNGQKLRVLSPGWWNLEAGPDFRNAALRIGSGPVTKGDVEVHLYASHWHVHEHNLDPSYNSVILHVALWNDAATTGVANAAGAVIPQVTLEPYLRTPLADLADDAATEEYPDASASSSGRCQKLLEEGKVTLEWLAKFLGHAGDQRIAEKARRVAMLAVGDDDQVLYETIAACLGYKRNKAPAAELTRRLPLAAIRERVARRPQEAPLPLAVEALLFGMAGLLPDAQAPLADAEAESHAQALRRLWDLLAKDLPHEPLAEAQWSFAGTRPANFPTRRMAALARLVAEHLDTGINQAIRQAVGPPGEPRLSPRELDRRRAQLLDLFLSVRDSFWDSRTHFTAKAIPRAERLIGRDRAHTLIIDAVLPVLLYQARRDNDRPFEEFLHQFFASHPKLPSTGVTRFMAMRLFGRLDTKLELLRNARRQQGLYQVYADFCDSETATCDRCPLVRLLEA
jgi:hypothetical protein